MDTEPTDPDNEPTGSDALSRFTQGIEEHMETGESSLTTSFSDRELASIAWPDTESWKDLSPQACEEAINRQLNTTA